MNAVAEPRARQGASKWVRSAMIVTAAVAVAGLLVWQGIVAGGNPNPTLPSTTPPTAALDIAVLVGREGLESILVLAVLIAGLKGRDFGYKMPIQVGAGLGFAAGAVTWVVATTLVGNLASNYGALTVQAATGMFAVVVLVIVMNWFFHGVYWSGWINLQTRTRRSLLADSRGLTSPSTKAALGLVVLGFASVYREAVEVVLFLQSYYLALGPVVVGYGVAAGLVFTVATGYLTFLGDRHLPYKKMLIVTGVLLSGVLFVMVGEEVYEMQLAGWVGTTAIGWMRGVPGWAQLWFSVFPNVQTLVGQASALLLVAGSYFLSRQRTLRWLKVRSADAVN